MNWTKNDLLPVASGGLTINEDYIFSSVAYGKIASVIFVNEGVNTNATLKFGGAIRILPPKGIWIENAPTLGVVSTEYSILFTVIDKTKSASQNLSITVQTYI